MTCLELISCKEKKSTITIQSWYDDPFHEHEQYQPTTDADVAKRTSNGQSLPSIPSAVAADVTGSWLTQTPTSRLRFWATKTERTLNRRAGAGRVHKRYSTQTRSQQKCLPAYGRSVVSNRQTVESIRLPMLTQLECVMKLSTLG